ncbi:BEM_collapsed_G0021080.mRNA.1.CDS.1 [Saccharomyces cerevisiae]|nr:BEM_HP_G0056820.mRNA.1.CDS.1 [Saccharomyces cerevisiae]CAI6968238.1 BEM_HP_G0056820.mRNA.1.CDS.1 [Saccharomyces cerevisiae]CAI7125885.1 BEM_collapsed_G0021080.mRNA.1.CDS.1 [Saccharomyces cerevisiae]
MASCNPTRKKSSASSLSMWRTILMALTTLPLSVLSQELVPANSTTSSTAPSITSLSAVESFTSSTDATSSASLSTPSIASVSFTSFPQKGQTILSNYYTTITYSPTASASSGKDSHHSGLSKKNRNIIIGCVVGIGAPLILILLILIYMFCVQPKKTDFIDSDGKIVTAYRSNIFTKIWYFLLGKKIGETERFSSDSPIGSNNIQNFGDIDPEDILNNDNPYTPKHANVEGYDDDDDDDDDANDENLSSNFHNRGIDDQYSPTKSASYSMSNSNSQDYNDADEVMHDENIHRVYDDSEASIDENYYTKPNNGLNITNY